MSAPMWMAIGGLFVATVRAETVESVRIGAAASLTDVLREAAELAPEGRGRWVVQWGASDLMARQVEAGAPLDVIVSADAHPMERLVSLRLVDAESVVDVMGNRLVLVVARDARIGGWDALASNATARVAIGDPATVPAGRYAERVLRGRGAWDGWSERLVRLNNVRAVLASVAGGDATAGFVYETDARGRAEVRIVERFDETETGPVRYSAGVVAASDRKEQAQRALDHLRSAEVQRIFEEAGFVLLE